MSGFYKYAAGRAGLRRGGRSRRHGAHRGRRCSPGPTRYVHALRAPRAADRRRRRRRAPNGVLPVEVYLAALQAGWYYVPINYRLSAPEIAYIMQDSGAKAFVSHERFADVIAAAADEAGLPAEARLAHGTVPGFTDVEAVLAAQPDTASRGPHRRRRDALHVGHHRQAQGREAPACPTIDPDVMAELFTGFFGLFGIPPPRRPGAPVHLAELPHRRHRPSPATPSTRATASSTWTSGTRRRPSPRSSATGSPTRTWCRPSSTGCSSCPTTCGPSTTCPRCSGPSTPRPRARIDVKQKMLDWWGPVIWEYYGATEGGGTTATPRGLAQVPGHRRLAVGRSPS